MLEKRKLVYKFSKSSVKELSTADSRLQDVAYDVLNIKDHTVLKGHRGKKEQNAAFESGHSKLKWPHGKHNGDPSKAIDVRAYPWPYDPQEQREEQLYLLGLYKGIGWAQGVNIRTGADWDRDGEIADNGFDDFFHVEIYDED